MDPALLSAVRVSLITAAGSLALALPPGIFLGWFLARKRFRGRTLVEAAVLLPLVLPPVVTGYLLLLLFGRNGWIGGWLHDTLGVSLVFNLFGMMLAGAVVGLPLLVRGVEVAIRGVDPGLEAAARTLGHSPWGAFRRITLPLARHGLIAGAVLAFARALGEFGATMLVAPNLDGTRTLALEIFRQASVPGGEGMVLRLGALSMVLSFAALLIADRLGRRGVRAR